MAAGGASPAIARTAAGTPCDSIGYDKPSELDNLDSRPEGSETYSWGTISWSTPGVEVTVNAGFIVGICVKGGNTGPHQSGPIFSGDNVVDGTEIDWTYSHGFGLSHLGYMLYDTATASISFFDPTCESGQTLNVDGFDPDNATIGDPIYDGANFTVVATAEPGAYFPDGDGVSLDNVTKTFTGMLSPPDLAECPVATAEIDFTAPTCTVGELLNEDGFSGSNVGDPEITVVGSSYTVVFTATDTALFPAVVEGAEVSDDRKTLTFRGTLDGLNLEDCPVATAGIAFTDPTCTVGELLNEDGFSGSNVGDPEITVVGSSYTVVFTATDTALFPAVVEGAEVSDDRKTLTFRGTLDGLNLEDCPVATAGIAFTDPTCTVGELLNEDGFSGSNVGDPEITVVGGSYTVVFTATDTALFPAVVEGAEVSDDRKTLTFRGTLEPKNEQHCVVVEASFTLPPATCEVGEDWKNPIIDADAGVVAGEPEFDAESGTVSITFLATGAHVFASEVEGETVFSKTLTVTLDVAGRDPELCEEPTYVVPVVGPTCELGASLDVDGIEAENASFVVIDDGSESGSYEVVF
ncbi:hypothetical protein, partial [Microcella alkalica]